MSLPGHVQSSLRQLKWLVVLLILSNVGLGIFGFIALRTIDRRYSELMDRSVPLLNSLQTLTARSVDAMKSTGPAIFEAASEQQADAISVSREVLGAESELRNR